MKINKFCVFFFNSTFYLYFLVIKNLLSQDEQLLILTHIGALGSSKIQTLEPSRGVAPQLQTSTATRKLIGLGLVGKPTKALACRRIPLL
jgi:hypothetical protein